MNRNEALEQTQKQGHMVTYPLIMSLAGLDRELFFLINHGTANGFFDVLMPALSANGYLLVLPYACYILWRGHKGPAKADFNMQAAFSAIALTFFSMLLADWIGNEIKNSIEKMRPCNALDDVRLLVGCSKSFSMPSGHASNSFAVAVALFHMAGRYMSRGWRLFPLVLASLIAYSRVYLGVHYPSDVLAGALFGSAIVLILVYCYEHAVLNYKVRPHITLLACGLAAISLFRVYYILHGPLHLSPDEAHYWEWARRPDLSYYSKGPMITYLIYAGTSLFGDTVFGVRIMAVILSVLSSLLLYRLAFLMYRDGAIALFSAMLLQVVPLFAPFGVLLTIDAPFIFFWTLSLYAFWKALDSDKPTTWVLLGISVGLGLLTKYTMAFFYLSGALCLFLSDKRGLLKTYKPYTALLVGLAVFSPVIIWNFRHDWVTLKHTAGQAHVAEGLQISFKNFFEFFGSQVGIITPILFFMMVYALFRLYKTGPDIRSKFLIYFSVPVITFFLLKSIQGKVQANWAMTGYITGLMALAVHYLRTENDRRAAPQRRLLIAGVCLALFVTAIAHYPSMINLPVKLDPSARLRGWEELGLKITGIYNSLSSKGPVLIFSDSYQVSSELAFYVEGHPKTYCINLGRRMNQYDLWPDMNEYKPVVSSQESVARSQKTQGEKIEKQSPAQVSRPQSQVNGIFVMMGKQDMPKRVAKAFERFDKKRFKVHDKGRLLREYTIFTCYNFKGLKTAKPATF